jgi:hypothetical protein
MWLPQSGVGRAPINIASLYRLEPGVAALVAAVVRCWRFFPLRIADHTTHVLKDRGILYYHQDDISTQQDSMYSLHHFAILQQTISGAMRSTYTTKA